MPGAAGKYKIPLVWENDYGSGKFVVVNLGIYVKAVRGIFFSCIQSSVRLYHLPGYQWICFFIWMIFLPRYRVETESIYTVIMV